MAKQQTSKKKPELGDPQGSSARQPDTTRPEPGDGAILDEEEIARLAYSYWEARGGRDGSPEEDWLKAERELKARRAATAG